MPVVEQHAPGTPSWVDLATTDTDAAAAFYAGLFGWEVFDAGDPEQTGGYRMCFLRGKPVAGMMPAQQGMGPVWSTYVTTADADATTAAARAAGGTVMFEPTDVMEAGRMAVLQDAQHAVFCIWQPKAHIGSGIVNEPGTLCWNELATDDVAAAGEFYGKVFGWATQSMPAPGGDYTTWLLDGRGVAGMRRLGESDPPGMPAHWLVYFAVEDCEAGAARIAELGGRVLMPPMTVQAGTFAVAADPQGAIFAVIRLSRAMLEGQVTGA